MVDVRYVVLAALVLGAAILIKLHPRWATPTLVALAVGTFAVLVMFPHASV